jgi:hypothetical protein
VLANRVELGPYSGQCPKQLTFLRMQPLKNSPVLGLKRRIERGRRAAPATVQIEHRTDPTCG